MTGSRFPTAGPENPLLPRQRDANSVLRLDEVIEALSIFGNGELHALDRGPRTHSRARRSPARQGTGIYPHVATIIGRENHGRRRGDFALADLLPIDEQGRSTAFAKTPPA